MHHHLFPSEDTYITNLSGYEDKNFGINEVLRIGTSNEYVRVKRTTKDYTYADATVVNVCFQNFTGFLSGSFTGSAFTVSGSIGLLPSFISTSFSGSLVNFYGELTSSTGRLTGSVTGTDTRDENWWETTTTKFADRTLIQFDLDAISASISAGEIVNPQFKLNLKVCNEYELPMTYKIYAFPVSESWVNGIGYYSDGGADTGASWYYRNYVNGTEWYSPITTSLRPVVDFLNVPANATASFAYGGGTWNYIDSNTSSSRATQSFYYESSDISMDVTNIVNAWLNGMPNYGFILMSSDEVVTSGSGFSLTFYGKDTNSINSPYLDIMWSDWSWETGSFSTGSVTMTSSYSGMQVTAQTGSTFSISGGVNGTFSGSVMVISSVHYITASNVSASGTYFGYSGSFSGSMVASAPIVLSYIYGTISGSLDYMSAGYFSGSVDGGVITEYSSIQMTGSSFYDGLVTGSALISTSSVSYFQGTIVTTDIITLSGMFGLGYYLDTASYAASGIVLGSGLTGNIAGLPIIGSYTGLISVSQSLVTGPCGTSFSASIFTASFSGGVWNGLIFSGYYIDGKFENAHLTGSWPSTALMGANITIPIPSGIDPYAYAYVSGPYIWGKAFGTYVISGSISGSIGSESASFSGQFIEGPLIGGVLNVQLSGSIYTSSYAYTSSVEMTSSVFAPLDTDQSFTVIIKDLKPEYKGGDVARIKVFGRKEFPIKTFGKTSQQLGYIVPELLPTSSYYAIKDNMSEEIIVDFDNYTQISCDYPNGNFFMLDTTGLAQERPYRILVRVENSGSKYTYDNGDVFKITR